MPLPNPHRIKLGLDRRLTVDQLRERLAGMPGHWLTPVLEVRERTTPAGVVVELVDGRGPDA